MQFEKILNRRHVILILLSWLGVLGFDFFLHAGLLSKYYLAESSFLLSPLDAFTRIPYGYAAFLILNILLFSVMILKPNNTLKNGIQFGLLFGFGIWSALLLALYSISTAPLSLLLVWLAGQTIELGIAGGIIGSGLQGTRLQTLTKWVFGGVVVIVVITIALQSLGFAPAARLS